MHSKMDCILEFFHKCEQAKCIPTLSEFITKNIGFVLGTEYTGDVVTWKIVKQYWTVKCTEALQVKNVKVLFIVCCSLT